MPGDLDSLYEAASSAWSNFTLPPDVFASYLRQRLGDEQITAEQATELYLACGCAQGDVGALRAFDEHFLCEVPSFISRIDSSEPFVDEVRQKVRERLLLATKERAPRIAEFTGKGRLASWLRVVTIREALQLRRGKKRTIDSDEQRLAELMPAGDPEMDYIRARYAEAFKSAIAAALRELPVKQRAILRLHLVDQLSIDKIGQLYDTHRATAARWLARAREQLFDATRDGLRATLGVSNQEFQSLLAVLHSQLDVSVARILNESEPEG